MSTLYLLDHLARAGGGGSSSGGSGGGGILVLPFIIISAIIAWYRRKKRIAAAQKAIQQAKTTDPSWEHVTDQASQIFYQFQKDWSECNVPNMRHYLTNRYFQHIELMMRALYQMNRQNKMSGVQLSKTTLFTVNDKLDNEQDTFDVEIQAGATDSLVDIEAGQTIFTVRTPFTELWHFDRENGQWKLDGIEQGSIDSAIKSGLKQGYLTRDVRNNSQAMASKMRGFALQNGFFYNADFGWLLLPQRGQLFSQSSFGRSDINFHVLGEYRGVLVQFYQYVPLTPNQRGWGDYLKALYKPASQTASYVIAQATLPRSYGNIIVQRKSLFGFSYTPRNMTRMSLEGVSFDKLYNVYATDMERAASLELLNPAYMEKLLGLPFRVSIEIVDNVLYLYSTDKAANFDTMLALLQNAFEEMKM